MSLKARAVIGLIVFGVGTSKGTKRKDSLEKRLSGDLFGFLGPNKAPEWL